MIIDKNIEILQKNEMHWIGNLTPSSITHEFVSLENSRVEYFEDLERNIYKIEDSYDSSFESNSFKKEIIFAIGVNSVYELQELYKKINKESYLVVIEPNLSFFNHVLHHKNLDVFQNRNVILFSDHINRLSDFIRGLFSRYSSIGLAKNIQFYQTNYYRKYELETTKNALHIIREVVRNVILSVGNSIEDGLDGLKNNLENLKWLKKSKDASQLKDRFKDRPAIVVSAGPSLNKNIEELKRAKHKAIIIAVDTIVNKLLTEGIIPDFVCSVERIGEVYEYFYENKNIPEDVTLVGPPLLDPRVFEEFKGDIILPMRSGVAEYNWLQNLLGLQTNSSVEMGSSCAHVAFGLAMHLGASPIILVGQDLAYGSTEEESHASGTVYDNKSQTEKRESLFQDYEIDGYYEEKVKSTYVWVYFKQWFEAQISNHQLFVINATEGGAKINSTIQKTLRETIDTYCLNEINPSKEIVNSISLYDINSKSIKEAFNEELIYFKKFKEQCTTRLENIKQLKITYSSTMKKLTRAVEELQKTNTIMTEILKHDLLRHNLQSIVVKTLWDINDIEQLINSKNLIKNKEIQLKMLISTIVCVEKIEHYLKEALKNYI
ncbi:motility associated factor glycosyltransferase family protein [Metabacillus fastidiosus]|uniref:motility associated factor glycosyltransferase family protein n=1 Tax=Metabacillus fastidiosus TaxID=1458 RepID=UPI003D2952B1